jgi:hypothetical protein
VEEMFEDEGMAVEVEFLAIEWSLRSKNRPSPGLQHAVGNSLQGFEKDPAVW